MLSGYPVSTRQELQLAVARGLDPRMPWIENVAKNVETVRRVFKTPSHAAVERLTGCTLTLDEWEKVRHLWWKLRKDTDEKTKGALDSISCEGPSVFSEGSQFGGSDAQSEGGEYHVELEAIHVEPFRGNVFEDYASLRDTISEVHGLPIRVMMRASLEFAQSHLGIEISELAVRQFMRQTLTAFHSDEGLPFPDEDVDVDIGFNSQYMDHVFSWLTTPADISSLRFEDV